MSCLSFPIRSCVSVLSLPLYTVTIFPFAKYNPGCIVFGRAVIIFFPLQIIVRIKFLLIASKIAVSQIRQCGHTAHTLHTADNMYSPKQAEKKKKKNMHIPK